MSKEIYISSTPHETRLAIVEHDELTEIYYERENEYTLAGSIYNGRVTRVLPGMQSSFVDVGLERDAFLYITDFMEEAGETAEFDHGSEARQRPAVLNATQIGRSESTPVLERSGSYTSERKQEQALATPQSDLSRASEGRTEEFGGRTERSGRSRGRGRRDRGGAGDAAAYARVAPGSPAAEAESGGGPVSSGLTDEDAPRESGPTLLESNGASRPSPEIGEASPGADGSRRWRGRRGRRRGRGTGPHDAAVQPGSDAPISLDDPSGTNGGAVGSDEFDDKSTFEIDGSASDEASTPTPLVEPVLSEASQRDEVGQRQEPRRREERGRNADRSGRTDRSERGIPRAPRGFSPTRSLYGVESEADGEVQGIAAPVEPLILPGESLGKYRQGGDKGPVSPQVSAAYGTPNTLPESGFTVDPSWDGGVMLPGETLSRYRPGQQRREAPAAPRRGGRDDERQGRLDAGRDGRERRNEPGEVRSGSHTSAPAVPPLEDLESSGPVAGYALVSEQTEEIAAHRPDFAHASLPELTAEAPRLEVVAESASPQTEDVQPASKPEASAEYEPQDASASYRIDTAPLLEYRQSAPLAESPADNRDLADDTFGEMEDSAGEGAGSGDLTDLHASQVEFSSDQHDALHPLEPVQAHQLTTLEASGTMVSEPETDAGLLPVEATSQIEVEVDGTVELDGTLDDFEDESESLESIHRSFAPGLGDLEEDFMEDEELEDPEVRAHGMDELEQEPLDGAADLGTMIRDMSLDHMTGSSNVIDEEDDDFEEDTLEEDLDSYASTRQDLQDTSDSPSRFVSGASLSDMDEAEGELSEEKPRVDGEPIRSAAGQSSDGDRRGRRDGRRSGRDRDRGRSGERGATERSSSTDRGSAVDRGSTVDRGSSSDRGSQDRGTSQDRGYDRGGLGERARNTGGGGDRERGRSNGRGRQSMQMTNLPAISELLKPGQEILVQIAKEPIAKKGARITSHIALPGRFLVFMPTVSHTGVSRKIESDAERRRLKEILLSEKGDAAGGFIVRTAADGASEDELRSDLRFLLNLWNDIKTRSESSKSPALIYHDLNLVERILRDQVTDSFSAIWVDTETEYERVLRFLQRFQPALIRRVKLYTKETPLFEQFGINEEINKALRSKVWLKSGGSIVINQTEALVAIDINTGKYVGKTARLEDTIVKTNLDAIPEIVRQIRLRDLGGIIIIDFIDMDERKNRNRVMAALEDELKNDRAPSKVLPFNDFGLVAITRKRVKQSLERTLSTPCNVCVGTGMVKSPVTVCNDIYVEMRKMHKHLDRGDVMLRVHPEVVKQLKLTGSRWLQEMEEMCGKTILIKSDPALHPEQFDIH